MNNLSEINKKIKTIGIKTVQKIQKILLIVSPMKIQIIILTNKDTTIGIQAIK